MPALTAVQIVLLVLAPPVMLALLLSPSPPWEPPRRDVIG